MAAGSCTGPQLGSRGGSAAQGCDKGVSAPHRAVPEHLSPLGHPGPAAPQWDLLLCPHKLCGRALFHLVTLSLRNNAFPSLPLGMGNHPQHSKANEGKETVNSKEFKKIHIMKSLTAMMSSRGSHFS